MTKINIIYFTITIISLIYGTLLYLSWVSDYGTLSLTSHIYVFLLNMTYNVSIITNHHMRYENLRKESLVQILLIAEMGSCQWDVQCALTAESISQSSKLESVWVSCSDFIIISKMSATFSRYQTCPLQLKPWWFQCICVTDAKCLLLRCSLPSVSRDSPGCILTNLLYFSYFQYVTHDIRWCWWDFHHIFGKTYVSPVQLYS